MSLTVAAPVADAIAAGMPVVALESTIIAHGFPRPRNLELARELEKTIAAAGVLPATVGVLDGRLIVGLTADELERIAVQDVAKLNVANLAVAIATGASGATTVSATLRAARLAGISIMATGGIGGVHRGNGNDVSADLGELARVPIGAVASGAKAFLDLAATLDYLETAGVTVIGYRTDHFPAFYSPSSGLPLADRVDSPTEAAAVIAAARTVAGGGVLIANPIAPRHALDPDEVVAWTRLAEERADAATVSGPARSPFVLSSLAEISDGRTVEANAALANGNAGLAAAIAVELEAARAGRQD
jgi:pseudouridine-5'-phosphate glycosidase